MSRSPTATVASTRPLNSTLTWAGPDNRSFGGKTIEQLSYPETQSHLQSLMSEHEARIQAYAEKYGVSREKASSVMGKWDNATLSYIKQLQQRSSTTYPAYMQEQYQLQMAQYQAQMNAYLEKMAEAMAKEEPAAEPLKAAAEVQSEARADTNRKQLLRRGLMSTLTRYGQGGQAQKLGA